MCKERFHALLVVLLEKPPGDEMLLAGITGDSSGRGAKKAVIEVDSRACSDYGFFQVVNHGVPVELMRRGVALSRMFFDCLAEEKSLFGPILGSPMPAGYARQPEKYANKNVFFLIVTPGSSFNVYRTNPPEFRETVDEIFKHFVKVGSLGLPPNRLVDYNDDRKWDLIRFPVLTNDRYVSASHRVVRRARERHLYAFFYNVGGDKWVEPLPQLTKDVGVAKYRGFVYKEYLQLKLRNKTNPFPPGQRMSSASTTTQ
ncbi:hypothetical protein MLD38_031933 [Melastoma candidum]|uniref:Uncharacterized protein n=1 Tax=Melastoma candidum TaxID=119954 RepID=A0ACB9MSB5_9MYRT|nr:hypothetical protein MLD38_031933 [Melastoma candidum]